MQDQIIYSAKCANVERTTTPRIDNLKSMVIRLCSCLKVFKPTRGQGIYQLGIESPKGGLTPVSRKYLVLDLDETLVHSAFQSTGEEDFDLTVI